jgi:hypothetical protein
VDREEVEEILNNLWDLRRRLEIRNEEMMRQITSQQRDFIRAVGAGEPVPPSEEVEAEEARRDLGPPAL